MSKEKHKRPRPTEQWQLVENPAYAGRTPTPLQPACHDGTHFVSIECGCGGQMHMHESQVQGYDLFGITSRCLGCGDLLQFQPGHFARAFAEMRKLGWIA